MKLPVVQMFRYTMFLSCDTINHSITNSLPIRRFGRASFSLTQLLTEWEKSSEVVVVTITLKDSNSGFSIKLN